MAYGWRLDNRVHLTQINPLPVQLEASTDEVVKIG